MDVDEPKVDPVSTRTDLEPQPADVDNQTDSDDSCYDRRRASGESDLSEIDRALSQSSDDTGGSSDSDFQDAGDDVFL